MGRLLAGAGLAAATLLGSPEVSVAQTADLCAPVYDETNRGDSSTALTREIGEYATAGVEVHVQIFESGENSGIQTEEDAEQFAEDLAQDCGWGNPNRINIVVSFEPNKFDVHLVGTPDSDIGKPIVDADRPNFIADLRDDSTPVQSDAARLLDRINPYDVDAPAPAPTTETTSDSEEDNPLNFPLKEVVLATGALTVLGVAGARGKRGLDLHREARTSQKLLNDSKGALVGTLTEAEQQLSVLPADDAKELRERVASTADHLSRLQTQGEEASTAYRSQRFKLWPDKYVLRYLTEVVKDSVIRASENEATMRDEITEIQDYIVHIEEHVTSFRGVLIKTLEAGQKLKHSGWGTGRLEDETLAFDKLLQDVQDLRKKKYVEKPGDMLDENDEKLAALLAEIESVPARREVADLEYATEETTLGVREQEIAEAKRVLDRMREEYDASCYDDIADVDNDLEDRLKKLYLASTTAGAIVGMLSVASLEKLEKHHDSFLNKIGEVDELVKSVHERQKEIERIIKELPEDIRKVDGTLNAAHDFAFEHHSADVEDKTRDTIDEITRALAAFESNEVNTDRPAYLSLNDKVLALQSRASVASEQAKTEKQEMDDLRESIIDYESSTQGARDSLLSYISRNQSDVDGSTESRANAIDLLQAKTSANRASLRNQLENFQELDRQIDSIIAEAEADVRSAEDAREEERRRRQRQEDDERRRRQSAAASSSSSFGSFGGSSNSGGGSHSSGSF